MDEATAHAINELHPDSPIKWGDIVTVTHGIHKGKEIWVTSVCLRKLYNREWTLIARGLVIEGTITTKYRGYHKKKYDISNPANT